MFDLRLYDIKFRLQGKINANGIEIAVRRGVKNLHVQTFYTKGCI